MITQIKHLSERIPIRAFACIFLCIHTPFLAFHITPPPLYNKNEPVVGLVFGASVIGNRPSGVLRNRLNTAVKLYNDGIIDSILVSGDNRESSYNEPAVMDEYLISRGIPAYSITQDPGGVDTQRSCQRAKELYGITNVYLITQSFHLPRAHYICDSYGLRVSLASAEDASNGVTVWGTLREIPATWNSLIETQFEIVTLED